MAGTTYAPKKVVVTIAGVDMTGYADGTFVEVEHTSDRFTTAVGADGEVTRVASSDNSGTITLTLQQSSSSNDILSALAEADRTSLSGKFPIQVKDTNGASIHVASTAWFQKVAPAAFAGDISDRAWVIACADLESLPGGNNS